MSARVIPPYEEGSAPDQLGKAMLKLGMMIDAFHLTRRPWGEGPILDTPVHVLLVSRVPIESAMSFYMGEVDPERVLPEVQQCASADEALRVLHARRP